VIDDDSRVDEDTQPTAPPSKKPEIQSKLVVPIRKRESARPPPPQFDEDEYDTDELVLMGSPIAYTDNAQNAGVEVMRQIQEGITTLKITEFWKGPPSHPYFKKQDIKWGREGKIREHSDKALFWFEK
jgi:hypothetical protein